MQCYSSRLRHQIQINKIIERTLLSGVQSKRLKVHSCPPISTTNTRGVDGTVANESAMKSARTLLSRVRAAPLAPWPDGGPESS
ncbi:thyrotropin-releasing hormone receptor [Plakobranchus ocellatus]|uniref:Thyrotropin-releasing hormone receptor n=1 Tax=Plakobranchus ocellatus TaxID=259542 RepID=A0AAV3Y1I8_9GAST|nr:thyrotropin-releasing hormone receptor [Plakobranchus ocellatus]